jgi:glutaminyl-tRNA synthetase
LRKVKGTLHWVSAAHAIEAEVRLYDRLFYDPTPDQHKDRDFLEFINKDSLKVVQAKMEPGLRDAIPGNRYQFQRLGYFCVDPESREGHLIFNRTVTLRDTWAKIEQKTP